MYRSTAAFFLAAVAIPAVAFAATGNVNLRATVPLVCNISVGGASSSIDSDSVTLGSVRELCNGSAGHQIVLSYDTGALVGATLTLGNDTVVLDGSGQALISDTGGAAFRVRSLTLDAGAGGFDTDGLDLSIQYKG